MRRDTMKQLAMALLVVLIMGLSACGDDRNTNQPAKPETQEDSKASKVPNTGNDEVNLENDDGLHDEDDNNDHLFDK